MESPGQILELARERVKEARVLCDAGHFDGAYYLAGYSIELMLKRKICLSFGIPNLFSSHKDAHSGMNGLSDVKKAVRTHDLMILLIFSGLKSEFDAAKASEKALSLANSKFFQNWSEDLRYSPCGSIKRSDCIELIHALSIETGVLKWIKDHYKQRLLHFKRNVRAAAAQLKSSV